jgi:putative SOS response-associated peptidase YedK
MGDGRSRSPRTITLEVPCKRVEGGTRMCGRYTLSTPVGTLADEFGIAGPLPEVQPSYNVAPTQEVPAVLAGTGGEGRRLEMLRWGLIPSWADDPGIGARMINARSETVAEKPSFRRAFKERRCLIPADGFYEWQKTNGGKQPYYLRMRSGRPFAFAGSGRTGKGMGMRSAPAPSSPQTRTISRERYTTGCRSSCRPRSTKFGWTPMSGRRTISYLS